MLDKEIERSLENLTWDAPEAVQMAARQYLIANMGDDLSPLFLSGSKSRWENCALVLRSIGRPRIDAYIPNFIEWMQDSNWPGHSEAQEILRMFDWEILEPHLRQAMTMAVISCDDPWVFSLSEIEMYFAKSQLSEQSLMEWELDDSIDKLCSYFDLEIQEKARRDVIDNIGADLRPLIMGGDPKSWANKQ